MNTRERMQLFLRSETVGGALLIAAALIGILLANSPLSELLRAVAATQIGSDALHLNLTVQEWTADGLLAIFFFVIGCELKHELVVGTLEAAPGGPAGGGGTRRDDRSSAPLHRNQSGWCA